MASVVKCDVCGEIRDDFMPIHIRFIKEQGEDKVRVGNTWFLSQSSKYDMQELEVCSPTCLAAIAMMEVGHDPCNRSEG